MGIYKTAIAMINDKYTQLTGNTTESPQGTDGYFLIFDDSISWMSREDFRTIYQAESDQ